MSAIPLKYKLTAPTDEYIDPYGHSSVSRMTKARGFGEMKDRLSRFGDETGFYPFREDKMKRVNGEIYDVVYFPNDEVLLVAHSVKEEDSSREYRITALTYTCGGDSQVLWSSENKAELFHIFSKLYTAIEEKESAKEPWHIMKILPEFRANLCPFLSCRKGMIHVNRKRILEMAREIEEEAGKY